jgi:uridine phosphorylase
MSLLSSNDDLDHPVNGVAFGAPAAPLLARTDHDQPSVFLPENLLREARRQKGLGDGRVPRVCVLDPDGDIARHVRSRHGARRCAAWACYHTELWEWEAAGASYGIVGSAVGASFAVLVAEQLFASGCEVLISIASAGQIAPIAQPPCHILVERALRDEGTSYHYLPPSHYAEADAALLMLADDAFREVGCRVHVGATWTTDAPFRETAEAIAARKAAGILAVEMEAAALYAFAAARGVPVLCLAHVTNQLGCVEGDFEKGDANGACSSIELVTAFASAWQRAQSRERAG